MYTFRSQPGVSCVHIYYINQLTLLPASGLASPLASRPSALALLLSADCCERIKRISGHLPKGLAFWVVANPLTEADDAGVDRIRRKVNLGAEVILTQPPLAWKPFER